MMIDNKSIIKKEVDPSIINNIIKYAKIMKANLILYYKPTNSFVGFAQDEADTNLLKILTPTNGSSFTIDESMPSMVVMTKDLAAIVKSAKSGSAIFMNQTNYYGLNDFATNFFCGKDVKECYSCFSYLDKYRSINNEIKCIDTKIAEYTNIEKIDEFKEALTHKASDGIQRILYDDKIIFLVPTFINALKNESIDLTIYEDSIHNYLLVFTIHKKSYDEQVIYRTLIL